MPTVSTMAEPNVAVVRSAHDVVSVTGSIFVHAHVPIYVRTTINMDMGTSVYVRGTMMAAPMMAAPVRATTVVTSSMTSAMVFRIRRRHDSKSERRSDR